MSRAFDAVIIGGGPAGSTAAALLARAGWAVAVVEKAPFPRPKVCGEFISATNQPLLEELGMAEAFLDRAGPAIKRVGLFAGSARLSAPMPATPRLRMAWGRALGRESLDTLLLSRARQCGAQVWQPWSADRLVKDVDGFACHIVAKITGESEDLRAPVIIAAHGSWEPGRLPSQLSRSKARASDLFGFKARFTNASLPEDLMPLLVFPGGYGGMVQSDSGRLSLSCCVRRDRLERIRMDHDSVSAADAVLGHLRKTLLGVREVLAETRHDGPALCIGPIQPGIRHSPEDGIFLIGNAAGEAHPIVAEGISMAMQSAWVLCRRLIAHREQILTGRGLRQARREYEAEWRRAFGPRVRAAAFFAQVALNPASANLSRIVLERFPALLSWGARWSGKNTRIVEAASAC